MVSQCCLWNSSLIFSFHCLVGDNPFHFLGPFDGQTSQRIKHNHHPKQILRQAPHVQFPRLTYPQTPQVSPFACCGAMVIFAQYLQEAERNLRNNHWPKDLSWIAILFARDPCGKQKGSTKLNWQSHKTDSENFSQSSIVKAPLVFLIKQLLKIEVSVWERKNMHIVCSLHILPRNLTWNLKMMVSKRNHLSRDFSSGSMLNFRGVVYIWVVLDSQKVGCPKKVSSSHIICFQSTLVPTTRKTPPPMAYPDSLHLGTSESHAPSSLGS